MDKKNRDRDRVEAWRLRRGKSKREVARDLGCTATTYQRWAVGDREIGDRYVRLLSAISGVPESVFYKCRASRRNGE